jgi:hypothetical protein
VTKRKKPFNICWLGVWWLDSSGTPSFIKWDSLDSPRQPLNFLLMIGGSVEARVSGDERKRINSLIILDGICPSAAAVLNLARDEAHLWSLAGAKGLAFLSIGEAG